MLFPRAYPLLRLSILQTLPAPAGRLEAEADPNIWTEVSSSAYILMYYKLLDLLTSATVPDPSFETGLLAA